MTRTTALLAAAASVALGACNFKDMSKGRAAAEAEIAVFHQRLDAGKLDEIYDDASDEFRAASPRGRFSELLEAVHRKLGRVQETRNENWNVQSFNLRTRVSLVQATTFEHGSAVETFVWAIKDGKATLTAYNINSQDLIVR